EDVVRADGVHGLEHSLVTAVEFTSGAEDGVRDALSSLLRVFQREAHQLREWDAAHRPGELAQQVLFRAATLGETSLVERARGRLGALAEPYLVVHWRTHRESPALVRILSGHQAGVSSVAVSPDGRHVVSGSDDATVSVWDLQTGQ